MFNVLLFKVNCASRYVKLGTSPILSTKKKHSKTGSFAVWIFRKDWDCRCIRVMSFPPFQTSSRSTHPHGLHWFMCRSQLRLKLNILSRATALCRRDCSVPTWDIRPSWVLLLLLELVLPPAPRPRENEMWFLWWSADEWPPPTPCELLELEK